MPAEGFWATTDGSRDGLAMSIPEIPGFVILERIGKGGMAEVYLARQLALGRLVAIKIMRPEDPLDPDNDSARFRREAELMAKVSHPNILSIFDFGESEGDLYLVVEFAEGGDLRRRMSPGFPMPLDQARSIAQSVGEALAHLHRQGIVHRDLKPENILLNEEGKPIVSDFGISILRAANEALTRTGRGPGTFGYIAPEQQYGLKVDERADQYSLAALTYEMLTGQLPLGIFKPPSLLNPQVSPEVDAVILRALREEPRERFATIVEFSAQLDQALAVPRPSFARPSLRKYGGAALSLLVLALAIFAYLASTPRTQGPRPPEKVKTAIPPAQNGMVSNDEEQLLHKIKEAQAYANWLECGSPGGEEGEAVKEANWLKAEAIVEKKIAGAAFEFWKMSGSPTGPAGEAAWPLNRSKAIRQLYKEMPRQDPLTP